MAGWRSALLAMGLALGPGAAVAAPDLFSYEASYSVQLARGSLSTGPRAANGVLDTRFRESCDGWETHSRVVIDLTFRDGTTLTNQREFDSFEAKDGSTYTFAVRTTKGGVPVEAFRGTANIKPRGTGSVVYEIPPENAGAKPRLITLQLPRGTLLPVRHALVFLEQAEKGQRQFRSLVFNGASTAGPRAMSTVIGPQLLPGTVPPPEPESDIDKSLLAVPAWDVNLAYYNLVDQRETPTFEVFHRYYASGITPSFEQQFDDFTIRAELDRLQRLQAGACEKK